MTELEDALDKLAYVESLQREAWDDFLALQAKIEDSQRDLDALHDYAKQKDSEVEEWRARVDELRAVDRNEGADDGPFVDDGERW